MADEDIRWTQRLTHFSQALGQLTRFIAKGELNELEQQGLIKAFEYTFELAWNTVKDYFEAQGETDIHGSRDAIRLAFRRGLVQDGDTWMDMIRSRTLTVHTYNQDVATKIATEIHDRYYSEFQHLETRMKRFEEHQE